MTFDRIPDSLDQVKFNAPYDVNFCLIRFSAKLDFIEKLKLSYGFMTFQTVCQLQLKLGGKTTKQEVRSYLNRLIY